MSVKLHKRYSNFSSRIAQESQLIKDKGIPVVSINQKQWVMCVKASKGPWKGKNYNVLVELPDDYPFSCFKATFQDTLDPSHPCVFQELGIISFFMLNPAEWRPYYDLVGLYHGLIWLLENPSRSNIRLQKRFVKTLKNEHRKTCCQKLLSLLIYGGYHAQWSH